MNPLGASRREFLLTCGTGLLYWRMGGGVECGGAADIEAPPILHFAADPKQALIQELSWDTEGGDRWRRNLLRSRDGVRVRVRRGGGWLQGADIPVEVKNASSSVLYRLKISPRSHLLWETVLSQGRLKMAFMAEGLDSFDAGEIELAFPFDPMVTPTTVLPHRWNADGSVRTPLIISAPDFGQLLLSLSPESHMKCRLEGSRADHIVDLILELPRLDEGRMCTITLDPVSLPPPEGLQDRDMWRLARRGWFNSIQPSSRWGDQGRPFSAPAGILGNNVISDPCSFSLQFYADQVMWVPTVAGISLINLVKSSIEFWLDHRTRTSGEVVGYWDYGNFLCANAGPIIAAWNYVVSTGDLGWLEKTIGRLEYVADYLARRDQDGDGIIEATQSGNANTLFEPERSCAWMDAVNHGHKDAYSNAIIYRAWRCLAVLESRLHRDDRWERYSGLAVRLRASFQRVLYNHETGWIADWRGEDGKLHDYASPVTNGLAIAYGLVDADEGGRILTRLSSKIKQVGFDRFDLGIPLNLDPIRREDYLQPNALGTPHQEDGRDTFQQYLNGGVSGAQTLDFLLAHYVVDREEAADTILRKMLARQQDIGFQNGVRDTYPKGIDIVTWEGKPCGYEGYLADVYYFLLAVLLREPKLRHRFLEPLAGVMQT